MDTYDMSLSLVISSKTDPDFKTTISLNYENMKEATMMAAQRGIIEPLSSSLLDMGFQRVGGKPAPSDEPPRGVIR